jgi:hypothetical protein
MTPANQSLRINALGKELIQYNLLTAFPLSDGLIKAYVEKIMELHPEVTPEALKFVINCLISENEEYTPGLGIQNILRVYKRYSCLRKGLAKELRQEPTHEQIKARYWKIKNSPLNRLVL